MQPGGLLPVAAGAVDPFGDPGAGQRFGRVVAAALADDADQRPAEAEIVGVALRGGGGEDFEGQSAVPVADPVPAGIDRRAAGAAGVEQQDQSVEAGADAFADQRQDVDGRIAARPPGIGVRRQQVEFAAGVVVGLQTVAEPGQQQRRLLVFADRERFGDCRLAGGDRRVEQQTGRRPESIDRFAAFVSFVSFAWPAVVVDRLAVAAAGIAEQGMQLAGQIVESGQERQLVALRGENQGVARVHGMLWWWRIEMRPGVQASASRVWPIGRPTSILPR